MSDELDISGSSLPQSSPTRGGARGGAPPPAGSPGFPPIASVSLSSGSPPLGFPGAPTPGRTGFSPPSFKMIGDDSAEMSGHHLNVEIREMVLHVMSCKASFIDFVGYSQMKISDLQHYQVVFDICISIVTKPNAANQDNMARCENLLNWADFIYDNFKTCPEELRVQVKDAVNTHIIPHLQQRRWRAIVGLLHMAYHFAGRVTADQQSESDEFLKPAIVAFVDGVLDSATENLEFLKETLKGVCDFEMEYCEETTASEEFGHLTLGPSPEHGASLDRRNLPPQ